MIQDSFIVGKNHQGTEFRASVLKLNRYSIAFEIYSPYSILQLSEVIQETKIYVNNHIVYSGRMVISSLVDTGIVLVCEATLQEEWLDTEVFSLLSDPDKLKTKFSEFILDWQKNSLISNDFKLIVSDIQILLKELKHWIDGVEMGIKFDSLKDRHSIEKEVVHELQGSILSVTEPMFEKFEYTTQSIDDKYYPIYGSYVKHQLHPLLLCSPFLNRTFSKPLGYAGDYEMVRMICRDPLEGGSLFAKIINLRFLKQAPAEAHRNRITYLTNKLEEETLRVVRKGRKAKIFNLGCGPAQEIQNFLLQDDLCDRAEFTLLDFNEETVQYTQKTLSDIKMTERRKTIFNIYQRSVQEILKGVARVDSVFSPHTYDFVYCAGLFDYLSDKFCQKLMDIFYNLLAPGGLLVVTNVDSSNPIKNLMRYILEWHLVYRDTKKLISLKPQIAHLDYVNMKLDSTRTNIFLEVRRPTHDENKNFDQRSGSDCISELRP